MEQLGIEPILLLAQVVNFAIILVVLTKLLYKPILGMLEKRKNEITEGLKITERMRLEEEKFAERKEKMLAQARKEGHVLIEEAKKQAKEEEKEIVGQAKREGDEIIEKGKTEVERIRADLAKGLKKQSVELAVAMARRLLSSSLSGQDKHAILAKHIKEIESLEA
jgi:F-type H+-transporting ATPase subunit b